MVCDYPQIITEVTPPRGQKGVWDNSQLGFHSSRPGIGYIRPGIGYRGGMWYFGIAGAACGIVVFWRCKGNTGYCIVQAFIVLDRRVKPAKGLKESAQKQAINHFPLKL